MHLIDGPGATNDNRFTPGDPVSGVPATDVTADWSNAVQEELAAVILASGSALNKADNTQLAAAVLKLAASFVPVGQVSMFYSDLVPGGYMGLQGQLFNRADHPALVTHVLSRGLFVAEASWAANWTLFGTGDGATTMRAPDFRGEFPRFWDAGKGVDPSRGIVTWQDSENRSHSHGVSDPGHAHNDGDSGVATGTTTGGGFAAINNAGSGPASSTAAASTGITIQSVGGPEARPRSVALLACIKT